MSDKNASDKKSEAKADAKPEGAEGAPKKKGGLKFALITVALLAIEGGVLFAVFSMGGPKDVERAVAAARRAFDSYSRTTPAELYPNAVGVLSLPMTLL